MHRRDVHPLPERQDHSGHLRGRDMRPPSEHTRGQNHSFYLFAYLFQPQRSRDQYYKCSTVSILTHAIVAVMESPMLMGSPSNQQEVSIFQLQLDVFDSICQTAYRDLHVVG